MGRRFLATCVAAGPCGPALGHIGAGKEPGCSPARLVGPAPATPQDTSQTIAAPTAHPAHDVQSSQHGRSGAGDARVRRHYL